MISFDIPALAAQSIKIDQASAVARMTGVQDARLAYHLDGATCHVSASTEMALCLVEALRFKAVRDDVPPDVLIECAEAIRSIFAAIELAHLTR